MREGLTDAELHDFRIIEPVRHGHVGQLVGGNDTIKPFADIDRGLLACVLKQQQARALRHSGEHPAKAVEAVCKLAERCVHFGSHPLPPFALRSRISA